MGKSVLERPPPSGLVNSQRTGAWQQGCSTKVEVQRPRGGGQGIAPQVQIGAN